tara:strand:- start:43 stop:366 length:324 start_codon:yes stop_codon:yes gene_type:complete
MIQYELEAITEAAIELVKDQPYAIKCEYDEELKKCVVKEWGEGVTPPSDSDLAAKQAEKLAQITYTKNRQSEYPNWGQQLDYIYHHGIDKWKTDIVDPVKNKYPKPS